MLAASSPPSTDALREHAREPQATALSMATERSEEAHERARIFARSPKDVWLVLGAVAYGSALGAIVWTGPGGFARLGAALMIALGTVWVSNTAAHNHLHNPIFVSRIANRALSLLLTVILFIPQSIWAQRHLWHHAGEPRRPSLTVTPRMLVEVAVVFAVAAVLVAKDAALSLSVLLPGYLLGLFLCRVQGHFEHAGDADVREGGVSHYGRLYNLFWFNDGHHAEHHRQPGRHWTELSSIRHPPRRESRRAPILRWLDDGELGSVLLGFLERIALRSVVLQRFMVRTHTRAFRAILAQRPPKTPVLRVVIVGGGLFPRTALALQAVLPEAELVIVDASRESLEEAATYFHQRDLADRRAGRIPEMRLARFCPLTHRDFDMVVFPLAFVGHKDLIQAAREGNRLVVTHDWIWNRLGTSSIVSILLLKRLNLVATSS